MTDISLEYAAGFFDGEGSVGVYKTDTYLNHNHHKNPTYKVCMTISNSDEAVMIAWTRLAGGGKVTPRRIVGHKTAYYWVLRGPRATALLVRLLPHLLIKREQAELAIEFQREAKWTPGVEVTEEEWQKRERYAELLRRMK